MDAQTHSSPVANHPDPKLVRFLMVARNICLIVTAAVAVVTLLGWLSPAARARLPDGWFLMRTDTALAFLLLCMGFVCTRPGRPAFRRRIGRTGAALGSLISLDALLGHLGRPGLGLDTKLVVGRTELLPDGMGVETALFPLLLGVSLLLDGEGGKARRRLLDALATLLIMVVLTVVSGYAFDATHLFGRSLGSLAAPQTLLCMTLLAMALLARRVHDGYYSVFVGVDVGSRVARLATPFALVTPFLIVGVSSYVTRMEMVSPEHAAAWTTAITATLLFSVVMLMARKINRLERHLLDLSLIDELTQIHNRRGFVLMGEHLLTEARRSLQPLTVLFLDLDDLKKVNDSLGHDSGSRMIADFGGLLRQTFRTNDVIARLGGDEFGVAILQSDARIPMRRLGLAVEEFNRTSGRPFGISFSVGDATTGAVPGRETFAQLVERADAVMYERKRRKKTMRAAEATA